MSEVKLYQGDSIQIVKQLDAETVDLILSDIPYGISYEEWDVLHDNTNSALGGNSGGQLKAGNVFKRRGKPLNGWSDADKNISKEYYDWCKLWTADWYNVLKPGASVFIFAGRRMAHRCIAAMEDAGFIFKDMIAWEKTHAPHRAQRVSAVFERRKDEKNARLWEGWRLGNLRPIFEPILWFMKPYKVGGTITDNLLKYKVGAFNNELWKKYNPLSSNIIKVKTFESDSGFHPTQKPILLVQSLIELSTKENQIVLDPFMGSGTTGVACKNLNRCFIGIELNKRYYDVANCRINDINQLL